MSKKVVKISCLRLGPISQMPIWRHINTPQKTWDRKSYKIPLVFLLSSTQIALPSASMNKQQMIDKNSVVFVALISDN